jgi:hypothetical protein
MMKLIYFDKCETVISPIGIMKVEFQDDPDKSGSGTVHLYKDNGEEVISRPYHDKKEKLDMFIDITGAMESVNE